MPPTPSFKNADMGWRAGSPFESRNSIAEEFPFLGGELTERDRVRWTLV